MCGWSWLQGLMGLLPVWINIKPCHCGLISYAAHLISSTSQRRYLPLYMLIKHFKVPVATAALACVRRVSVWEILTFLFWFTLSWCDCLSVSLSYRMNLKFPQKSYYDYEDLKSTWNQNFHMFYFTSPFAYYCILFINTCWNSWQHVNKHCFSLICNKWRKKKGWDSLSTSFAFASKFATIHTGSRPHPDLFWSIFACNSNMPGFTVSKNK